MQVLMQHTLTNKATSSSVISFRILLEIKSVISKTLVNNKSKYFAILEKQFVLFSSFDTLKKIDFQLLQNKNLRPHFSACGISIPLPWLFQLFKLFTINYFSFIALYFLQKNLGLKNVSSAWLPYFQKWIMSGIAMRNFFKSIVEELQSSDVQQLKYILRDSFTGRFHWIFSLLA